MSRKLNTRSNNTSHATRHHSVNRHKNPSSFSRTPSSVCFSRSTSSNSLPAEFQSTNPISKTQVTHVGSKSAFEETKTPPSLPASYTVSSSAMNVNNGNKPRVRPLNPAAKEFKLPTNGTPYLYGSVLPDPKEVSLFAMPSQRLVSNMPTQASAIASDYTTSWNAISTERQPRPLIPTIQVEHPINYTLNRDDMIVEKLVNHFHTVYMYKCKEQKLHMVAVLNLELHTTHKQLLDIFSAMSPSEAIILKVEDLPFGIVNSSKFIERRGVGVVFFSEKDFAMLGVEKLNNFVPSGQHQQLTVRYCGPDAALPAPSGATALVRNNIKSPNPVPQVQAPWILPPSDLEKVHEEMRSTYGHLGQRSQFIVAIHGLCSSTAIEVLEKNVMRENGQACERWPPKDPQLQSQLKFSIPWRCRSISAVVWYSSEYTAKAAVRDLNNRIPEGQQQKVSLCLLGAPKCHQPYSPSTQDNLFPAGMLDQRDKGSRVLKAPNSSVNLSVGGQVRKGSRVAGVPSTSLLSTRMPGNDNAVIFAKIEAYFLSKFSDEYDFFVAVHKLDIQTDKKNLHEIFYPSGAVEVELYPDIVTIDGKPRRSGVALFLAKETALEAASRFNDFVPNGQTRPLLVRYLERRNTNYPLIASESDLNASYIDKKETISEMATVASETGSAEHGMTSLRCADPGGAFRGKMYFPSQQSRNGSLPYSTPRAPLNSLEDLLCSIRSQLSTLNPDAELLEEAMVNLANHPDSTEVTGAKLAKLLVNTLIKARHESVMLLPKLSDALLGLHDRLGIPKRDIMELNGTCSDSLKEEARGDMDKRITFVKQIAKELLLLVTQEEVPPQTRRAAGTLCAYLFQYSYLRESPFKFAVEFLTKRRAEQKQTVAPISRDPLIISDIEKYNQGQPWVHFIVSLDDMTRFWLKDKSRIRSDDYAMRYQKLRAELLTESELLSSGAMANSVIPNHEKGTKTEPSMLSPCGNLNYSSSKEATSGVTFNRDSIGGTNTTTAQGIGSANLPSTMLTPSARPTPLRVTKGSMTSGSGNKYKPPLECAHSSAQTLPPRVMLTPGSNQTQGMSANISLESNADQSLARVYAYMSDLNAQSPAAAHNFQPFPGASGVASKCNISPSSRFAASAEGGDPQAVSNTNTRSGAPMSETNSITLPNMDAAVEVTLRPPPMVINHRSDISECTVYITKLPSSFTASQVRRLFLNFGSFTKVRLCHDDKEGATQAAASSNQSNSYGKLCFVFVEFAESPSAKAIVEYFRNASHIPNAFDFMRQPSHPNPTGAAPSCSSTSVDTLTVEQKALFERDIRLLAGTRASPARKPIHDQQYLDAVLRMPNLYEMTNHNISPNASVVERECLFGVLMPDLAIENYNSNSHPELRPPLSSVLSNNINNSNPMANSTPPIAPVDGKGQAFVSSVPPQPTLCASMPVASSTPICNTFIDDDSGYDQRELDIHIQGYMGNWTACPSISHEGSLGCGTKVPLVGVIGDSVDGIDTRVGLDFTLEPSLTGYNDSRSEDNDINRSPGQPHIWTNFSFEREHERGE
ncbi:unnamed protein product [Phytomonas sp. EM1]|nr:unnamed protein product [Phytomonas sp. EM1]|eukprot:CCW61303.1 unnamed protein product [Phytomonas sp. isolate EM1]